MSKWSHLVETVSTFPPKSTFTKKGEEIADIMSRPEVSPKGLGSAIKMVQFYTNRAGRSLSSSQKKELEKAKRILQRKSKEDR